MSRHRAFNKSLQYDDYGDDYDQSESSSYSDYGTPSSPSAAHYMFRNRGDRKMQELALRDQREAAFEHIVSVLGANFAGHSEDVVRRRLDECQLDADATVDSLFNDAPQWKTQSDELFGLDLEEPVPLTPKDKLKQSMQALSQLSVTGDIVLQPSPAATRNVSRGSDAASVASEGGDEDLSLKASSGSIGGKSSTPSRRMLAAMRMRTTAKQAELDAILAADAAATTKAKQHVNLVVIGHVDHGKSTINGHLLILTGRTDARTQHRFERDSKAAGKASFALAWAMDEHEEERARGVTINVGINHFETEHRVVTLLDAPGHRDFVPNMITGAAQADFAVLVVDATPGEFETGFSDDGQTKEHAVLARSLGVTHLIVAVNKMDLVEWSQERFDVIAGTLSVFLKHTGFRDTQITYLPVSGLTGANLQTHSIDAPWFDGPTLLEAIDTADVTRDEDDVSKPFRFCINDVYKSSALGLAAAGRVEAGVVMVGDTVYLAPLGETATVKAIHGREMPVKIARVGDNVDIGLTGMTGVAAVADSVTQGHLLCDPAHRIPVARRVRAQVLTFASNADPILKGHQCVFHTQSMEEPCTVTHLRGLVDRATGEMGHKKPRLLNDGVTAVIEIRFSRGVCLEKYTDYKKLGRFMLRRAGKTIAAGIVTDIDVVQKGDFTKAIEDDQ